MQFKSLLVVCCVVTDLMACGIAQAGTTSQSAEGAWVGTTTSTRTGKTTPAYGFILSTGEYFFITDAAYPEITFGTSIVSAVTIVSTDMKTYHPKQGAMVHGWLTGTLNSEQSLSIQFLSNDSGAMHHGNFTLDANYKVPSSLTIVTGTQPISDHQEVTNTHSLSLEANSISAAVAAECAAKDVVVIVLAPKVSIACR